MKLEHYPEAIQAFRDALRCQPDLVPALVNLGDLLSRTGRRSDLIEARQHLQRALQLAPKDPRAAELLERVSGG